VPDLNLKLKQVNNISYLTSPQLLREGSILVAFTTRHGGYSSSSYSSLNLAFHVGDRPDHVRKNRQKLCASLGLDLKRLTTAEQIHSSNVKVVTEGMVGAGALSNENVIPQTDALITNLTNTPLTVFLADCLPVVLVDPVKKLIGVVHAGWQGIYSEIVLNTFDRMEQSFASSLKDVVVFIGPGIGSCCYAVDSSRASKFRRKFPFLEEGNHLDLKSIVSRQLIERGIPEKNISKSEICTSCRGDLFFSYRRERECGRQAAIAAII
jgi:YfiH family protein